MIDLAPLLAVTGIPVNVAVLDAAGTIVGVNAPWRSFADANGACMRDHGVGQDYLAHCGDGADGAALRGELERLLDGRRDILTRGYPCHSPDETRWCLLIGLPLVRSRAAGAVLMHANLTELLPALASTGNLAVAEAPASHHRASLAVQRIAGLLRRGMTAALPALFAAEVTAAPAPPAGDTANAELRRIERAHLSARQRQVFAMLGEARSNADIAAALGVSPNTVKVHVSEILKRLELHSRTQVALLAAKAPEIAPVPGGPGPIVAAGVRRNGGKRPKPRRPTE
jgi:DNA-binding NarL/FixJ family response regulator